MESLVPTVVFKAKPGGLFLEVPVDPNTGPFLASGSKDLWWPTVLRGSHIRAAICHGAMPDTLYLDMCKEVHRRGVVEQWGATFPFTPEGVVGATGYLDDYGMGELELLTQDDPGEGLPMNVHPVYATWVPKGCAVLVPQDRTYLGFVGIFDSSYTAVLHNPSRGMAFLGPW